jgi:type II secretory pathway pseudopilin PulG
MEVSFVWKSWQDRRQAFTLVEIMIIVALIGLLAALAIPTYIKVRKQAQGKRIINDARIIDAAIDSWTFEKGMKDGDVIGAAELTVIAQYTKKGAISTVDVLGNPYTIGPIGATQVVISAETKAALTGVTIDWGPY